MDSLKHIKRSVMKRLLIAFFCLSPMLVSAQKHVYRNPMGKEFPIMAWYSILPPDLDKAHYEDLAEAGFNLSFSHFGNPDDVEAGLKAAKGTGVKLLITCPQMEADTESLVRRFKKYKTNAGYFLRDEPACPSYPELRAFADRIRKVDDSRVLYLNLLPTYVDWNVLGCEDYNAYVRRFIKEVGLGLVSFDNYPVVTSGVRDGFYQNLEIVRDECLVAKEPFWAFALATAHVDYPVATRASLRLQIFSNLAYGAQGIQYFTYSSPGTETWDFHNAPIDANHQRTEVYDLVAELNHEVQALSAVFLGAEVIEVAHTGKKIPTGTHALSMLPQGVAGIESDGEGLIVSYLRNHGNDYLMIVNRDIDHSQRVTVALSGESFRVMPDGSLHPSKVYSPTLVVEAGDMLLFKL